MAMTWDGIRHPNGCGCYRCIAGRGEFSFSSKFEQPNAVYGRLVHEIGRVRLEMHISRKRRSYDLLIDHKLEASSRDFPDEAFRKARAKFPKKDQKVTGEIFAYRGWNLMGDILTPITRIGDYITWAGPVATSERDVTADEMAHGSNGLYAAKIQHAEHVMQGYRPAVHGIVGLFGIVVEHEMGYRSQHQIVRVLRVVPPVGDLVLQALEQRYQCQVFRQKKQQSDFNY